MNKEDIPRLKELMAQAENESKMRFSAIWKVLGYSKEEGRDGPEFMNQYYLHPQMSFDSFDGDFIVYDYYHGYDQTTTFYMPMEVLESDEKATEWAEEELVRRREEAKTSSRS